MERKCIPAIHSSLNIKAADDLNHDVSMDTIYTALVTSSMNDTAQIDPQYAYVANGSLGVTGQGGQTVTLQLDVVGNRDWRMNVDVNIEECPIGYRAQSLFLNISSNETDILKESKCECIGGQELYSFGGNLICDEGTMTSKIRNGFWIGFVDVPGVPNDKLFMGLSRLLIRNIPDNYLTLNDSQISNNTQCSSLHRTGTLCGECIEDYSVSVNSYNYECVPCTHNNTNLVNNALTYVALTYLPYLLLFLLIIIFNINLMSGSLSGFILYAQLIGSGVLELTIDRLPTEYAYHIQKAYRMSYGVFNLNSFSGILPPFCVGEHFSALEVIGLDYAVAIFPLVLIILIWVIAGLVDRCNLRRTRKKALQTLASIQEISESSASRKIGKSIKNNFSPNFIHAFVGFIYLSYTKMSLAATLTLTTTGIFDQYGSYVTSPRLIYYAGQYYFGQSDYLLPYGALAFAVYCVVIGMPFLLLGGLDLVNWLTGLDRFAWMRKIWPSLTVNSFLDAMRDCYRPKRRYFVGIYFLFRLVMLTIFAFSSTLLTLVLCQLLFIVLMILLVAILLPHKEMRHNFIDIVLLLNMAAITLISIYLYSAPFIVSDTFPISLYSFGATLIWLPMFYLFLYFCSLCLRKTRAYRLAIWKLQTHPAVLYLLNHFSNLDVYREMRQRNRARTEANASWGRNQGNGGVYQEMTDDGLSESTRLLNRADQPNSYRPAKPKVTTSTVFEVHDMYGDAEVKDEYCDETNNM